MSSPPPPPSPPGSPTVDDLRAAGNTHFRAGRWAAARDAYTAAITLVDARNLAPDKKLFSNRSAAHLRFAQSSQNDREMLSALEAAVADATAAVDIDRTWPKGWCRAGTALLEASRYAEAVDLLGSATRYVGDSADVQALLSEARALAAEHEAPSVRARERGDAAAAAGRAGEALAAYASALRCADEEGRFADKRVYIARCHVLLRVGDVEEDAWRARCAEAEASAAAARDLARERSRAHASLRMMDPENCPKALEVRERALADAEKAVKIDCTDAAAWQCLALALIALQRVDEAQRELRKAMDVCGRSEAGGGDIAEGEEAGAVPEASIGTLGALLREVTGHLDEREQRDAGRARRSAAQARAGQAGVKDTTLYDVLGVAPDATDSAIKKAYYLQAKRCHPDRHPDDPDATEKFQKLGDAYQVLSNDQRRALYDTSGLDGVQNDNFDTMDSSELFDMLFGSDQFEFLIGELQLASLASNVDEDGNPPDLDTLKRIRTARVRKLVDEMLRFLDPWLEGDKTAFVQWANTKASCLSDANNGHAMLFVIGQIYSRKADIALGKNHLLGIPAMVSSLGYSTHKLSTQIKASGAAIKVMDKQRKMQEQAERADGDGSAADDEETMRMATEMVESAFDMMWKITIVDIQTTLDDVADHVLHGKDLPTDDPVSSAAEAEDERRLSSFSQDHAHASPHTPPPAAAPGASPRPSTVSVSTVATTVRNGLLNPAALASKLSLDSLEKSLERFLLPKKEHREGRAVRARDDVLHARATGLKKLGRIFMQVGQGASAADPVASPGPAQHHPADAAHAARADPPRPSWAAADAHLPRPPGHPAQPAQPA